MKLLGVIIAKVLTFMEVLFQVVQIRNNIFINSEINGEFVNFKESELQIIYGHLIFECFIINTAHNSIMPKKILE